MNIVELTEFFKWMTIANFVLFFLSFLLSMVMKGIILSMHSKMFGVSEATVQNVIYGFFGIFKIFIIVFNFTPYIALLIMQ